MDKFKLTYTDEMKKQDELWKKEEEDLEIMEQLQRQVIYEAKVKGWEGSAVFWEGANESIVDIAENEEEHEKGNEVESYGYCKALIARIEADMGTHVRNEDIIEEMRADEVKVNKEINNKARRVRAWDKAYNSMDYQFFLSSHGQAYARPSSPGNTPYIEIEQSKGLILMEFVGKDDFDTDIFEDDVVSYFDTKEKKTKYAPVHYDKKAYGYLPMCKGDFEDLRVVGNIYENKELEQLM